MCSLSLSKSRWISWWWWRLLGNFPFSFLPDGDVSWARGLVLEEVCLGPLQEPLSWVRGTVVHLKRRWQEQAQGANSSSYPTWSASTHRLLNCWWVSQATSLQSRSRTCQAEAEAEGATALVHLYTCTLTGRYVPGAYTHICKQHCMAIWEDNTCIILHQFTPIYISTKCIYAIIIIWHDNLRSHVNIYSPR